MSQGLKQKFPKNKLKLKKHCSTNLFKEMCDLLFEIADKDDNIHQSKSRYLNKHIAKWIQPKENSNSNSTSRQCTLPEPPKQKDCYRCTLPLTPGHAEHCEGVHATCRHCGTKGHVKNACGKLGFFPENHHNGASKRSYKA